MINWNINITVIFLIAGLILSLGLVGGIFHTNNKLKNVVSKLNTELMKTDLKIGRAETKFGNAEDYIGELEQVIQDEIEEREAKTTMIAFWKGKYEAKVKLHNISTHPIGSMSIPTVKCASANFEKFRLYRAKDKKTLQGLIDSRSEHNDHRITIGCQLSAIQKNSDIYLGIGYQLHMTFGGQLAETITPSGAVNHYVTIYELDEKGKRINKLKLTDFNVVLNDQRSEQFYWLAPHLDIGAILGSTDKFNFVTGGSLGISMMGYGLTDNDLSWRLLRISIDFHDSIGIGVTPALYNLGDILPLVSNIWFGPHIGFNTNGNWYLVGFIGAVL